MKTLLALVCISGGAVTAHTPQKDVRFSLDTAGTTQQLPHGSTGQVQLQIRPRAGYKVNGKGPLSVALAGTNNLIIERAKMGRADAKGASHSPVFSSPFVAQEATGTEEVHLQTTFVLCDTKGTFCELKKASVTIQISVQSPS